MPTSCHKTKTNNHDPSIIGSVNKNLDWMYEQHKRDQRRRQEQKNAFRSMGLNEYGFPLPRRRSIPDSRRISQGSDTEAAIGLILIAAIVLIGIAVYFAIPIA